MLVPNNITIRKSFPNEAKDCYQMIQKLAIYEGEDINYIITEKEFLQLTDSNNPVFHCVIAKIDDTIAGIATYYYRYSSWKGKHIHLEDLYIDEKYRKLGIGKLIFTELTSIAKKEGLKRIEWEVSSNNEKAKNFYIKMGADIIENWKICRLELN